VWQTLGIAPLTSMFFFGENQPHRTDFRPEVHDSDGLMVATGSGEWIWRPLLNPRQTLTTSFSMETLRGFGLMQRDRDFRNYEDSEARYELRPSAWVEPTGTWAPGRVELMQLHTPDETNDNVVAYWVPATRRRRSAARFHVPTALARTATGAASAGRMGSADARRPRLCGACRRRATVRRRLQRSVARCAARRRDSESSRDRAVERSVRESNAYRVEATGAWRMTVIVKQLNRNEPTELRGFLQSGNDVLTETWSNILPPLLQR
jgi:glucans biosynthesis protein